MDEVISSSLVAEVRGVILATFDVSIEDAQMHALGLVCLAEGWGGSEASHVDWAYTVKKQFGSTLKWRSDAERQQFDSLRDLVINSYERLIQQQKQNHH